MDELRKVTLSKPDIKGQILYDPSCMTTQNKEIHRQEVEQKYQGLGVSGWGNGELLCNGLRLSVQDDDKVLEVDGSYSYTTL